MLTAGVDLAAEPERTAVARIAWSGGRAGIADLAVGATDADVLDAVHGSDKAGIDCPIGWPRAFVAFVTAHQEGHVTGIGDGPGRDWRRPLANRVTDIAVREATGLVPLSVAADRIAHAAMRCAGLLGRLAADGTPVDRRGGGRVVEVYPAAALKLWGLPHRGYKRAPNLEHLDRLVDAVAAAAPWLDWGPYEAACRRSDDALDAVLAALATRAVATGRATRPAPHQDAAAASEGWIALPTCGLADLAADRA